LTCEYSLIARKSNYFGSLHAITRTTWAALLLESVMKAIHTAAMVSAIALSR
jgi:hypothetical protein